MWGDKPKGDGKSKDCGKGKHNFQLVRSVKKGRKTHNFFECTNCPAVDMEITSDKPQSPRQGGKTSQICGTCHGNGTVRGRILVNGKLVMGDLPCRAPGCKGGKIR